jgi:hypothetical protein
LVAVILVQKTRRQHVDQLSSFTVIILLSLLLLLLRGRITNSIMYMLLLLLLLLRTEYVAIAFEDTAKLTPAGVDTFLDNICTRFNVVITIHPVRVILFRASQLVAHDSTHQLLRVRGGRSGVCCIRSRDDPRREPYKTD